MIEPAAAEAVQAARPALAPRVSANVRWALLGTAANSVTAWLVLVVLARASGPAAVGTYALALALTAPVMMFTNLQLRTLLVTDAEGAYVFREYRALTSAANAAGLLGCAAVALVLGAPGAWGALAGVFAMRAADAYAEVYLGLWQRAERMSVVGLSRVVQLAVTLALVVGAALLGGGAAATGAGAALGSIAMVAYLHVRTARDPELRAAAVAPAPPGARRRLGALAARGLPLGFITLLGTLQFNVPRYFIELHAGAAALGLFAAACQLTSSGTLVVGAISGAVLPRLTRAARGADGAFEALTWRLALGGLALGAAGTAASALFGREVLVLLYRPEFGGAATALLVLSVGAGLGFASSFLGLALTSANVIKIQAVLLVATLAVLFVASAILTPGHGSVGAAWAVVVGAAVQTALSVAALLRSRGRRPRTWAPLQRPTPGMASGAHRAQITGAAGSRRGAQRRAAPRG